MAHILHDVVFLRDKRKWGIGTMAGRNLFRLQLMRELEPSEVQHESYSEPVELAGMCPEGEEESGQVNSPSLPSGGFARGQIRGMRGVY